jgi:hypothetical protein
MNEIVASIQKDILSPEISLSTVLLKAKLLAHTLKNESFKQWVKHEVDGYPNEKDVPDYRIIQTPLLGYIFNGWNGYNNIPISLLHTPDWFQQIADKIYFTRGIQTVEELASAKDSISFDWSAECITFWNACNRDQLSRGGYQCHQVKRPVTPSIFAQIQLTVRSRLQDFVLELSDLPWDLKSQAMSEQVENLISVNIYNRQQQGVSMATFDQRDQHVYSQNNAARDIYIETNSINKVQDIGEFIHELQKLKSQLSKAGEDKIIDAELVTDVDYELASAIQEAKKPDANKDSVLTPMKRAENLLGKASGTTEFITAIINLIAAGAAFF